MEDNHHGLKKSLVINIINWFAHQWRFEPTEQKINLAVQQIASENMFHPVREYLNSLKWDNKPRVAGFLKNYFHAVGPNIYLRAVSKKFLCAMVARIYQPGIKFDNVLILEGKQGVGKSTASRILGGEWFTDTGILNIGDKDSYLGLQGKWLIELGELSSIRKADLEKLKAYIAGQSDDIRPPYARRSENFLRQSVFIGTTNADNYLNDPTGNRRFWPVKISKCENELLKKDRDQLFAEAIHLLKKGEKLYLNEEENTLAEIEQKKRMVHEPWIEEFIEFAKYKKDIDDFSFDERSFTLKQLTDHLPFANLINDQRDAKRMSSVLRTLNYRTRSSNGKNLWELNIPKDNSL
jgi:putative DNA primase/helicase